MAYDKVVDSAALDAGLLQIANAIREKAGTEDSVEFPDGFAELIGAISGGAKVAYGSFTPAADAYYYTCEHGLDEVPIVLLCWVSTYETVSPYFVAAIGVRIDGFDYNNFSVYTYTGGNTRGNSCYPGGSELPDYTDTVGGSTQNNNLGFSGVTSGEFTVGSNDSAFSDFKVKAATTYNWVALGG